jgi:hypothetical protein
MAEKYFGSVRDMIQQELIENGFDGLKFTNMCCCKVGNLMNCVGKKDRVCFVDQCKPVTDIKEIAKEIVDNHALIIHPDDQMQAIISMSHGNEPEFVF